MTLALLLTAVGGAWAQGEFSSDPYTSTTEFNSVSVTSSMTLTIKEGVIVTVNSGLTIEDGVTLTLTGGGRLSVYGKSGNWGRDASYEEGTLIVEATAGGDGNPAIILNDNAKIVIDNGEIYAEGGLGGRGGEDATAGINKPDGAEGNAFSRFPTIDGATLYYKNSNEWFKYTSGDKTLYRVMKAVPPTFEVTLNDPKTEASFEMPTYDVNFSYELVRDMQDETNPVAFSGLPSSGKIIVKKGSDGKYQPAEALTIQLIDPLAAAEAQNIIAADGITIKVLVGAENEKGAIDYDQDNPITLEAFLADMKPGYYWIKAEQTDENSPYDGTVYSSEFTVVEKYDLTVKPAKDFSKGKIESVTVGTETVTPDANTGEATKTGIAPDTEVKIKAKNGYKIKSATAKQKEGETTVTVTVNEAKTEASFDIPTFDVDFSYELVRDMAVDVAGEMADRIRIQMVDNAYQTVDATQMNPVVKDNLETNSPVTLTVTTDYTLQLQKQSDTNADEWTDATALSVGTFRYKITGAGNYSGICYSEEFALFQGYEVTVPAGEYISYYQSEALYVEDEDAVLYTIANVTATEAQLSDAIKVAPAETPLLVYNKSEQNKTFLLIPTTENADEVTPAKEFKGSLTEGEIPASSAVTDYYALNGKAFVWVKYAIEIGANKCWLQIGDQPAAARAMTRSIVGGGDTTNMDDVRWQMEDGNYYDLQGRKVEKPNRKGIYIKGGKKVIVR